MSSNFPTFNKYLLIERNPDGLPRHCGCRRRFDVEGLDRSDIRPFIGRREDKVVADFEPPRRNASGNDAAGIELIDVLNRQTKRLLGTYHLLLKALRVSSTVGPCTMTSLAAIGDVVTELCAHRNNLFRNLRLELSQKFPIFFLDAVEDILTVADQIHLVHDHGKLPYSQKGKQIAMLLDCSFTPSRASMSSSAASARGRAGDHVLEKFFVSRRIDDDVLPALPDEERPCRIDRDPLLLLFEKGIEEERILEFLALLPANGLYLFQLAVGQRAVSA